MLSTLENLFKLARERKEKPVDGSYTNKLLSDNTIFDYRTPNYDFLYGWCPKRKLFLQHATVQELLELDLISNKTWNEYYKFTINLHDI